MTFGYFSSQKSNAPPAGVQIKIFCKTCAADRRQQSMSCPSPPQAERNHQRQKVRKTMRIADQWQDFEILDTSSGEKLERWGNTILIRPDPQVIWRPEKGPEWQKADARYNRSSAGGGSWATAPAARRTLSRASFRRTAWRTSCRTRAVRFRWHAQATRTAHPRKIGRAHV